MLYWFCSLTSFFICKVLFQLDLKGTENIPKKGGFILASNHTSNLDPIILGASCRRRMNFMAKDDLFRHKVFAKFLGYVGAFPIKRDYQDVSSIKESIKRLKNGQGLVIFPSGTRVRENFTSQVQAGVGLLSQRADVGVVPTFIDGAGIILPKGRRIIKRAKLRVTFGRPIKINSNQTYLDFAKLVMQEIANLNENKGS